MKEILICGGGAALEKVGALLRSNGYSVRYSPADKEPDAALVLPSANRAETLQICGRFRRAAVVSVGRELHAAGAVCVPPPVTPAALLQTLAVALEMNERLHALEAENERLKGKIDDLKLIDRAKCALVQYLGMTEQDAHRFIEKRAMDQRIPRRAVALDILRTYEP